MSPMKIYWDKIEHKYKFNTKNPDLYHYAIVPCGKCPECRSKWRTQLVQRVRYELTKYGDNVCFLTLTANDDCIDEVFPNGELNHRAWQLFIKRLRRHLEYRGFTGKIKYLVNGEYGHDGGRPHFHAIIFGWKPDDLKLFGRTQKGFKNFKSEMLQKLWKKVGATKEEIDAFNNNPKYEKIIEQHGGKFDYLPLGFIDVGEVEPRTAGYMVKYICKFSEVKSDDFIVNGKKVKKPYLVYPKKILGIDHFIENYEQILTNGFIYDDKGRKTGIPRSFLKYAENSDDIKMNELFLLYKERVQEAVDESNRKIMLEQGLHFTEVYDYVCELGRVRREMYNALKNKNR